MIVTTHFMEEAEYCDHVVIHDHGRVLARGTPAEIRRYAPVEEGRETRMEDAFIAIVEAGRRTGAEPPVRVRGRSPTSIYDQAVQPDLSARTARIWTLVKKEVRQILRDPAVSPSAW